MKSFAILKVSNLHWKNKIYEELTKAYSTLFRVYLKQQLGNNMQNEGNLGYK